MFCSSKSLPFTPSQDIPRLTNKVILVTGANTGLGKHCVLEYARHRPSQIWLAARTLEKAQAAAEAIRQLLQQEHQNANADAASPITTIKPLAMDLSSLSSVTAAAHTVLSESADRLDILMLNAGIMAAPPGLTSNGYELQFGTNYIGHALLTKLLLPLLEKTAAIPNADVRVIALSSHGHVYAPSEGIRFDTLRSEAESLGAYGRYGQSKLAIILWAREMARRYPAFTTASVHPGVVRTNLMDKATGSPMVIRLLGKVASRIVTPVEQGVRNQLWASVSKEVKSGEYYEPVGIGGVKTEKGEDDGLAARLWEWTEMELQRWSRVEG